MTLRFLAATGGGSRARLAAWVRAPAVALLLCGCAAQSPSSSTAAMRIPPLQEQLLQFQASFAPVVARHARLISLARERYPHYFAGSADGRTLITLVLDDDGHVTASDFVNSPSHWFARDSVVEPWRLPDRAFDFLVSQGVPLERAIASTSFIPGSPPSGGFVVSPPSTRPELMFAVYDPARRMTIERKPPQIGASPEAVRAIVTRHFPELYENPTSGDTREWIWALMDSSGDLLRAGRQPEPPASARERARILESRYPGIEISHRPLDANIRDGQGKFLVAHGDPLVLTVYWLEPGSPLP
jgi:hypothetical protein